MRYGVQRVDKMKTIFSAFSRGVLTGTCVMACLFMRLDASAAPSIILDPSGQYIHALGTNVAGNTVIPHNVQQDPFLGGFGGLVTLHYSLGFAVQAGDVVIVNTNTAQFDAIIRFTAAGDVYFYDNVAWSDSIASVGLPPTLQLIPSYASIPYTWP